MSVSGIFGKSNLSGLHLIIEWPQEMYAGKQFPLKITLLNKRKFLPAFLVRVKTDTFEVLFPFVDTGSSTSRFVNITFPGRGLHRVAGITLYSVFPFNFFTRFKYPGGTYQCIVFPALKTCDISSFIREEKEGHSERFTDRTGYDSDVVSIREYTRGDPLKYIHWKASAKTGRLKTKELSSPVFTPVVIEFDKIPIENIEDRISAITYIIVRFLKMNTPIGLRINKRLYLPGTSINHRISLLRTLALHGTDDDKRQSERKSGLSGTGTSEQTTHGATG